MGEGRVLRSLEDGVSGEQSAGRITNLLDEFEVKTGSYSARTTSSASRMTTGAREDQRLHIWHWHLQVPEEDHA